MILCPNHFGTPLVQILHENLIAALNECGASDLAPPEIKTWFERLAKRCDRAIVLGSKIDSKTLHKLQTKYSTMQRIRLHDLVR